MIKIENLYKTYNETEAVKCISFEINSGEMFGIIGPDGAGKTTIIRILCGLINSTSGEAYLMDKNIKNERSLIQKNIGYLSQIFSLYGDLTVDENIDFFANIHNITDYHDRRNELLTFTNLIEFRNRLANNLSGGMKQKLSLACSLIHKPKILFLDEPTTGVDPVSRRDFWKILANLKKDGITIVLTTPYLDEAERCTRVAFMNEGEIMDVGTPSELKAKMTGEVLEIVSSDIKKTESILKKHFDFDIQLFGDRINIVINNFEDDFPKIEMILLNSSIKITEKRVITPTLENLFINMMR
ncbi:MAG: ABC transporter ATP-binding protein [Melioribacteraceae bacterium]|nr:ABC transporter ATP-binding protein [Melioribacteraceae bacterium]